MYKNSFLEKIKKWFFFFLVIITIIYFSVRIFYFLTGPKIKIYSPLPGEIIKTDTFFIEGNAQNAKNISINGKDINIDEKGDFKEEMIAKSPYTLIVVNVVDKYGKVKEEIMQIGKE